MSLEFAIVGFMSRFYKTALLAFSLVLLSVGSAQASSYKDAFASGFGWTIGGANSLVNYNMNDPRWANSPWGGISGEPTMASSACGATALAVVGATLNDNRHITPMTVAHRWVKVVTDGVVSWYSKGQYDYISAAARSMNLRVRNVGHNLGVAGYVVKHGGLAIVLFAPGYFTHAGHYVVIRASLQGGYYLADPDGLGEFGHDNEDHSFSGSFLRSAGHLMSIWVMQPKKNNRLL